MELSIIFSQFIEIIIKVAFQCISFVYLLIWCIRLDSSTSAESLCQRFWIICRVSPGLFTAPPLKSSNFLLSSFLTWAANLFCFSFLFSAIWNTVLWISVLSTFHQCLKYNISVRWIPGTINTLIGVFSTFAMLYYWTNYLDWVVCATILSCFCCSFKLWLEVLHYLLESVTVLRKGISFLKITWRILVGH